jgi:hypothetical protein
MIFDVEKLNVFMVQAGTVAFLLSKYLALSCVSYCTETSRL